MQTLSDVEWIFLVLAGLYLMESLVWVRPGTVVFWVRGDRLSNPLRRRRLIGNERGELVAPGLLPIDATLLAESPPISMGTDGVLAFVAAAPLQSERPRHSGKSYSWKELERLQCHERELYVGDERFCVLRSRGNAQALFQTIRRIATASADQRAADIDAWRRSSVDFERAREQFHQWQSATGVLRASALLLFLLIFPLGLVQYYQLVPWAMTQQATLIYLSSVWAVWWWSALHAFLAHRKLYPERRGARAKQLFTCLISPVVPLRAADHMARELFAFLHPLTLSVALHPEASVRTIAAHTLRDLEFPRLPDLPVEATGSMQRIAQEDAHATRALLEAMLRGRGIDMQSLAAAPERDDPSAKSYCPRCWEEYVEPKATCTSCGERPTVAYDRSSQLKSLAHAPAS